MDSRAHPSSRRPTRRRVAFALLLGGLAPLVVPAAVAADPPGPTEYRTEIIAVDPPTSAIDVEIIGGDSFVLLSAQPGVEVEVIGYEGEPYLRFLADGTVEVNEASPARWLNDDRFGDALLPPTADASAQPRWVEVAGDASYAWHDHRSHWMNPAPPPGAHPGDTVLEAVVPIVVDGTAVDIAVRSIYLDAPSPIASAVGVVAALVGLAAVWVTRRRSEATGLTGLAVLGAAVAATATGVGAANWASVPAETGPSLLLWLTPALAGVAFAAGAAIARRPGARTTLWASALVAVGGAELLVWVWNRRLALTKPIIPSPVPGLDRAVLSASLVIGLAAVVWAAASMLAATRSGRFAAVPDA